jgi:succinoglycan biosynthesis transport protein ExoP
MAIAKASHFIPNKTVFPAPHPQQEPLLMEQNQDLMPAERVQAERYAPPGVPLVNSDIERTDAYFYLRSYVHILLKRRWTVLTVAILLTSVVAVVSFKMQPIYRATARVEVEAEAPQIQSLNDLYRSMPSDDTFLQTQVDVLESDNLAWQTIQQMGLAQRPQILTGSLEAPRGSTENPAALEGRLIRAFRKHLDVKVMRNSRMIEINFESAHPHLAANVANALVRNYAEYNFRKKYDATRQASGWMEAQLDDLKAKVERSQQALVDYERQNAIVNVGEKQNVVEQRLADLSKDLTTAQNDLMQKQSLYELTKSNKSQAAVLGQDELLQKLEENAASLQSQYVAALDQYGPQFPKVLRLHDQVEQIESLIDQERFKILERIESRYLAAADRVKLLSEAVAREKVDLGEMNQLQIQHNLLKREFETNQQLYESLLKRLKDATVSAGLRANNIHVVDAALVPSIPVRPQKLLNAGVALGLGLIIGIALAFLEEGLDNSIRSSEDVERLIPAPALAIVPSARSVEIRPTCKKRSEHEPAALQGKVEMVLMDAPASALAESYRALRTSILLSTASRPPQSMLVTSPNPNEGKSCTSLNLALALAQRGGKVLIVDGDLRKQGIARHFGMTNERGLSSYLAGAHPLVDTLRRFDPMPSLWVLPAGPLAPNPAELLSSAFMERLVRDLRQSFDHIVIDSPPALMVTDATILSRLVDGTILVVENGMTVRGALVRTYRTLHAAGARILGVVMNKVDLRRDGYYYYGRSYGHNGCPYYYDNGGSKGNGSNGHVSGWPSGASEQAKLATDASISK